MTTARHELEAARTLLQYAGSPGNAGLVTVRAPVAGKVLKVFAPKGAGLAGKLAPAIEDAVHDGASDKPSSHRPGEEGYDQSQRRSVDDLVEKSR